jgi:hypothetical protein
MELHKIIWEPEIIARGDNQPDNVFKD